MCIWSGATRIGDPLEPFQGGAVVPHPPPGDRALAHLASEQAIPMNDDTNWRREPWFTAEPAVDRFAPSPGGKLRQECQ